MYFYEVYDSTTSALLYPVNYLRNYARMQVRWHAVGFALAAGVCTAVPFLLRCARQSASSVTGALHAGSWCRNWAVLVVQTHAKPGGPTATLPPAVAGLRSAPG